MKSLRLILAVAVLGITTVAIGAPQITKGPTSAKVVKPRPAPTAGSDVLAAPPVQTEVPIQGDASTNELIPHFNGIVETTAPSAAAVAGGNAVNMDWYSINNGGAIEVAAGNIKMGLSIGQNAVGEVSAGNIKMGLGFWYGAGTGSTPSCVCDCHADPECDGFTDILDVSALVNVAFRDGAPLPDPNGLCPYQTTDVDCSGFTDIIDVSRMVEVAFRNGSPAAQFCSPCAPVL